MNFINYFSATLEYRKDSNRRTEHISAPDLNVQNLQQMLKSKQQYLVPGFAYLYLYHGLWFFDEPGQESPRHTDIESSYVMFGDYNYDSLKTSIEQNPKYAGYTISPRSIHTGDNDTFYVSNIDTDKKVITLDSLFATAIVNPVTLEQIKPTDSQTGQGNIAPTLNNFFNPIPEINPIPKDKQLEFVENCVQFAGWVKQQKNIKGK